MTNKGNTPVLRIIYFEDFDLNIFDIVEEALNRANLLVEQFGGGSYFSNEKDEFMRGYSDFYIKNYNDFDVDFCRDVTSSILPFKFDIEVYEDDPLFSIIVN